MSRQLIVYGGTYDGRNRLIVAAYTKKAAYEAIAAVAPVGSYKTWNDYTSDTENENDVAVAAAEPGVVFKSRGIERSIGDYVRVA